ncbi:pilus assembly protein PilM, partial [bacterium]|nr:pilus assembly protein PilM [bacterium]
MFDDEINGNDEKANPSSMLLMDAITSTPKESSRPRGIAEQRETADVNEKVADVSLENFISGHESEIHENIQKELSHVPLSPDIENPEFSVHDFDQNPTAAGLRWWERIVGSLSIGIEINARVVRAAKIRTFGKKQEIVQVEEISLNENEKGNVPALAHRVKQVIEKLRARNIPITSIIGGSDVNIRLLRMPKVSKKEIHEALLWKNKKELHFFNDAPTVLHYVILDEDQSPNANEFYVLVIAVREELIKNNLEIMMQAGVIPQRMTIRPIAQWNFMKCIPDKGMHSMVIDIGFESTHLSFFRDNTLQFAREISVGGNHFTSVLMQTIFVDDTSYVLSWEEAEELKKEIGLPADPAIGMTSQGIPHSEIAVMMRPVAEKLASEIRMSLDYYKENFKVETYDNVYFSGKSIRLKRLGTFLQASIGQTMRPFRPSEHIAIPTGIDAPEASILSLDTVGAALSTGSDLNFLPPNAKTELRFRNLFSKAVSSLLVLFAIAGGSILFLNKKSGDLNVLLTDVTGSLKRVQSEHNEFVSLQNEIKTLIAGQSRIVGETAVDSSSIAILKWISEITPDEIAIERL